MDDRPQMVITGERTVPGLWHENYWYRRHEVVYESLLPQVAGLAVLEAGCGEGYGARLLATSAKSVMAIDYDDYATGHVRRAYPSIPVVRGNLVAMPWAEASFDVVVSLQTIEHLWDQDAFLGECVRALRPGGLLAISTPNTLTFPPGNIYHPKELTAGELHRLVAAHAHPEHLAGLRHGASLSAWETSHGPIADRQIARPYEQWDDDLAARVRGTTVDDFVLSSDDPDGSLDLVITARRAG